MNKVLLTLLTGILLVYPFSTLFLAKMPILILAFSLCVMVVFELIREQGRLIRGLIRIKWFVLLSALYILSIQNVTVESLASILVPVAMVMLVQYSLSSFDRLKIREFKSLLILAFLSFCVAEFYLVFQYGGVRATSYEEKQVIGSFANVMIAPSISIIAFSFFYYKYERSKLYLVAILIATISIFISLSRTGHVLLFLVLIYGFVLLNMHGRRFAYIKAFGIGMCSTALLGLVILLSPTINQKFTISMERFENVLGVGSSLFSEDKIYRDDGDYKRRLQYFVAQEVLSRHSLDGIGYGEFPGYMEKRYGIRATVHNMFLKTWVAIGISGVIVLIILFVDLLRRLWMKRREALYAKDEFVADFYLTTMLMLGLFILQGQFRGMFGDYIFLLVLGLAYSALRFKPQQIVGSRSQISSSSGKMHTSNN